MHFPTSTRLLLSATILASAASAITSINSENKCTFPLFHKQLLSPSSTGSTPSKENYIRIPSITDHANALTIPVAHFRPDAAFDSYVRVSARDGFVVEGLVDGGRLSLSGRDGDDGLEFKFGMGDGEGEDVVWTAGVKSEKETQRRRGKGAWCNAGNWDVEIDQGRKGWRERRLECAFPCAKLEEGFDYGPDRIELRRVAPRV